MSINLRSDTDLKHLAKEFFAKAQGAVCQNPSQLGNIFQHGGGFRTVEELVFVIDPTVHEAEINLIVRCLKLLGSRFGHEKEIREMAWKVAKSAIVTNVSPDTFVDEFVKSLESHTKNNFWYICPNYLVSFRSSKKRLTIGPVEAMPSVDVLNHIPSPKQVTVATGREFTEEILNGKINIQLPPVVWRVEVNCAAGHVPEEAGWYVDVAVSLLRLHYEKDRTGLFPVTGDIEASPFIFTDGKKKHLITGLKGLSSGSWSLPRMYAIDDDILDITLSQPFIERAVEVFNGGPKQLSTRFAQGLGWMSRARRAEDRAERILFFFTAIEALLSSDDKSAPVVQNIARQAAVILQDDPGLRAKLAATFRELYGTRSTLVHTGKRSASQTEANTVQNLAEALYITVMQRTKLDIPFEQFQNGLSVATYGTKWP